MGKILLMSDTQFGNHKQFATYVDGFNSRFLLQLEAYDDALSYGKKKGCTRVIHCGDFFHVRGSVRPEVFNAVKHTTAYHEYERFDVCSGNHDFSLTDAYFNTAYMLSDSGTMNVHTETTVVEGDRFTEIYVPWNRGEVLKKVVATTPQKDRKRTVLFIHATISGMPYGDFGGEIDIRAFKGFHKVFAGDVHVPCSKDNVLSIGCPWPITFGDSGKRFVYVLDESFNVLERYSPKHPMFRVVDSPDSIDNDFDFFRVECKKGDVIDRASNVRVVVERGEVKSRKSANSDVSALKRYCEMMGREDMFTLGRKYLEKKK